MARLRLCAALAVALVALAAPISGARASEGKVVIAQGVDPSTLDAMNQQETPASVVAAHLYDTLVERDQNLKLVPGLAAEMPKLLAPRCGRSSCARASSSTTARISMPTP